MNKLFRRRDIVVVIAGFAIMQAWYDFAKAICRGFGYMCDVNPCRSADYPSPVQRPSYSVLDKSLFKKTFSYEIPHWEDSLQLAIIGYSEHYQANR